jgi:lambda family phage portal protein
MSVFARLRSLFSAAPSPLGSSVFDGVGGDLSRWIAPSAPAPSARLRVAKRLYAGAEMGRLNGSWVASSTSADAEIVTSLRTLRDRSRQLERDNDYAKNAVRLLKNNIAGRGVGFQSQVMMRRGGRLDDATNSKIERAWRRWCRKDTCSTSGKLSFAALQRLIVGAMPTGGEILVRMVKKPFGGGKVPFALEVIESDQLIEGYTVGRNENGRQVRMGVELDEWNRATGYFLYPRHPGDLQFPSQLTTSHFIYVPASEVLHLFIPERPNQSRGVPWFHTAIKRLHNMGGYEEAEIVAARASACIMGFIESPDGDVIPTNLPGATTDPKTGETVTDLAAGEIRALAAGEKFTGFSPTRPNPAMEGFMRFMLRGMCAGVGMSYASVSGDYSQSNYSSSRLALLDDRDNWRVLQDWLVEDFCQPVFEAWLEMAVLSGELALPAYWGDSSLYTEPRWLTRGWSYVDPLKEVMADKLRVRSGFSTVADVIAAQGGDFEDVFAQRRRELDMAKDLDLVLDTDPALVDEKGSAASQAALGGDAETGAGEQAGSATEGSADSPDAPKEDAPQKSAAVVALERAARSARHVEEREHLLEAIEVLQAAQD